MLAKRSLRHCISLFSAVTAQRKDLTLTAHFYSPCIAPQVLNAIILCCSFVACCILKAWALMKAFINFLLLTRSLILPPGYDCVIAYLPLTSSSQCSGKGQVVFSHYRHLTSEFVPQLPERFLAKLLYRIVVPSICF